MIPVGVRLTGETLTGSQEQSEQTGQANQSALPNQARLLDIARHGCPAFNRRCILHIDDAIAFNLQGSCHEADWRERLETRGDGRKLVGWARGQFVRLEMSG